MEKRSRLWREEIINKTFVLLYHVMEQYCDMVSLPVRMNVLSIAKKYTNLKASRHIESKSFLRSAESTNDTHSVYTLYYNGCHDLHSE